MESLDQMRVTQLITEMSTSEIPGRWSRHFYPSISLSNSPGCVIHLCQFAFLSPSPSTKQQGQTLAVVVLQLDDPCFIHGQRRLLQNGQSQPALSAGTQPQCAPT